MSKALLPKLGSKSKIPPLRTAVAKKPVTKANNKD